MDKKSSRANAILISSATSLTFFWVLNLLKTAFPGVKAVLNFFSPIGPLLGLFVTSIFIMLITYFAVKPSKPRNQQLAFWALVISATLFFLMVFPPIYEPIVHIISPS